MDFDSLIEKKDKPRFSKVSCQNILDLALLVPSRYENRFINNQILIGQVQAIKAKILSLRKTAKTLQLQVLSINTNTILSCTIFNYKAFHLTLFKSNTQMFLLGKISLNQQNTLELSQPKVIQSNDIDIIYPKYTKIVVKNLIAKYLSVKNIMAYGIDESIAKDIVHIHNPDIEFINNYQLTNSLYSDKLKSYLKSLKFVEIFNYLLKMQTKKRVFNCVRKLDNNIKPWIDALPFKLTKDQSIAICDIQKDFLSKYASRRIIVGDVGSGKSIIIFACALIAYPYKSLLMAPTTVLANQLYDEAKKFIGDFMDIELVTNNSSKSLKPAHLTIGTHAILHKDFKDISLIMIDEQHKFGSNQRQSIEAFSKQGSKRAHFLQFSATPIPRTMAMIESSLIDFSFIKTTPFKKNIQTKQIYKQDFKELILHIQEQINQKHQIIIVYPLVETSEHINYSSLSEAKDFWLNKFDDVYVTYGGDKEKNNILQEFANKGSILLATTLIEVGISLPKLSTIVIVGAERLGLASLHQLRGRVSRTGLLGYCFLYSNNPSSRLESFAKLTSGFDVADLDLEYRESGDIVSGGRQSGKMFTFANLSQDASIVSRAKSALLK